VSRLVVTVVVVCFPPRLHGKGLGLLRRRGKFLKEDSDGLSLSFVASEGTLITWTVLRSTAALQVRLPVQCCGKGHVVQSSLYCIHAIVRLHSLNTILGLVRWQFPTKLLRKDVRLVCSQYSEAVNNLLCGVDICGLPGHEVQEAVELDIPAGIGVHDGEDTLEVYLALLVLTHGVSQGDEAVLELLWVQPPRPALVKVVEAGAELVELLLGDALAVSGQDLVLNLVDGPVD